MVTRPINDLFPLNSTTVIWNSNVNVAVYSKGGKYVKGEDHNFGGGGGNFCKGFHFLGFVQEGEEIVSFFGI